MRCKRGSQTGRQERHSVFSALAVSQEDLRAAELDVLHAQPAALEQPQARSVEERSHQPLDAIQLPEECADLATREHDGKPHRALRPDDLVHPRKIFREHVPA